MSIKKKQLVLHTLPTLLFNCSPISTLIIPNRVCYYLEFRNAITSCSRNQILLTKSSISCMDIMNRDDFGW